MICVECGQSVNDVLIVYSAGNIRLTRCHACGEVADKYVEFEGVLIAIDMVLHKLSVYRHLLFNRLPYTERYIPANVGYFAFLILALETYSKVYQARLPGGVGSLVSLAAAAATGTPSPAQSVDAVLSEAAAAGADVSLLAAGAFGDAAADSLAGTGSDDVSVIGECVGRSAEGSTESLQCLFAQPQHDAAAEQAMESGRAYDGMFTESFVPLVLSMAGDGTLLRYAAAALIEWAAYVGAVLLVARVILNMGGGPQVMVKYNYLVISIILSSFGKLLLPLSIVWDYDALFLKLVSLFVLTSNVVATRAFTETTTLKAVFIVGAGVAASFVARLSLYLIGAVDTFTVL